MKEGRREGREGKEREGRKEGRKAGSFCHNKRCVKSLHVERAYIIHASLSLKWGPARSAGSHLSDRRDEIKQSFLQLWPYTGGTNAAQCPTHAQSDQKRLLTLFLFTNTAQRTQGLHYFSTFPIDSYFDSQPSPPAGSHFMHSNKAASSLKNTDSEQYCFAIHNTSQSTPKRHLIRCDAPHAFTLETRAHRTPDFDIDRQLTT